MNDWDEIIDNVMDNVSTKMTNGTSTDSKNCRSKKVRDCYFTCSFISHPITVDNYYYLLLLCKTNRYNIKWKWIQKNRIKNCTCYYFDDIIKLEDFGLDNILINEKSHENILIYDIS